MPGITADEIICVQPMYSFPFTLEPGVSYSQEKDIPEWYWVRCNNYTAKEINEMQAFCVASFGAQDGKVWDASFNMNYTQYKFNFANEQDQMLFLLRWTK